MKKTTNSHRPRPQDYTPICKHKFNPVKGKVTTNSTVSAQLFKACGWKVRLVK